MANMTLAIPEDLHEQMQKHSEIKWSEVARKAFQKEVRALEIVEKILEKSEFTEQDAEEIGHKVKKEIRKRF